MAVVGYHRYFELVIKSVILNLTSKQTKCIRKYRRVNLKTQNHQAAALHLTTFQDIKFQLKIIISLISLVFTML